MTNPLTHHFATMAYNNAWANHRLLKACALLSTDEFMVTRTSYFPSIKATLNHILTVDWFYLDALERDLIGQPPHPDCYAFFAVHEPFENCVELQREQADADQRLIAYCRALSDDLLGHHVEIARPRTPQRDTRVRLLAHLFQHQIHHRGQVHAMLAGTSVKLPQLDEFFCEGEAALRAGEFSELGWKEATVWQI